MKSDIKSLNQEELIIEMENLGEKRFRALQIYDWIHKKQAADFFKMTNISKGLKEKLAEMCIRDRWL